MVQKSDGNYLKSQYDAEYLRAETVENGKESKFLYCNGELLAELNQKQGIIDQYILGYGVAISNRILYTGQQYDQASGQYYLKARYYNPAVGRFLQEDVNRGDGLKMARERQENIEKYQREMQQPEISLENAELCSRISKYSAEDNEVVFWKKKELEIREKYYGKNSQNPF